jgi:hypothetical protein
MGEDDTFERWMAVVLKKPWKAHKLEAMLPDQPELVLRLRRALEDAPAGPYRSTVTGRPRKAGPDDQGRPPRDAVVGCRVGASELEAIDLLVEAGIRSTRSDAAAWFIQQGIQANAALVQEVRGTVDEIRRLRERAQRRARERDGQAPDRDTPATEDER